MDSFLSNFLQTVVIGLAIFLSAIFLAFSLNYLQAHIIKSNVENYAQDLLTYGTKHNGFNDPVDGDYTFRSIQEDMKKRNKLDEYLLDERFYPEPGTQVSGRSGEINMQVKYRYPKLSPLRRGEYHESSTKVLTNYVHGYVKEDFEKDFNEERPWWVHADDKWEGD